MLRAALRALRKRGFTFEAGGEPFLDIDDGLVLGNVVKSGACLTARHRDGAQLDLMLSASGFGYRELAADSKIFMVAGVPVRVGHLEKLLRSKQLTGRPKDIEFLRLFAARSRKEGMPLGSGRDELASSRPRARARKPGRKRS
jgi:hypothetical protein